MSDRDSDPTPTNVRHLVRVDGPHGAIARDDAGSETPSASISMMIGAWLTQLRQRWILASSIALLTLVPIAAYAVFAVPAYTSSGVLQVSTQQGGLDPMLELVGGGGSGEIETEVEIIRRREFVLAVFKDLRLHIVDAEQATVVTTDPTVSLGGQSPTSDALQRIRAAASISEVASHRFKTVELGLEGIDDATVAVELIEEDSREALELTIGEPLVHDAFVLGFEEQPLAVGERITIRVLPDGSLLDRLMPDLAVASMGDQRRPTNLVSVSFTHPDRDLARAVVDGIMQRYLAQSLSWQSEGAAKAADFIEQRLAQAQTELRADEEELRTFAERERAVQLDTQARVTIENAAALEAERRQAELQESVLGTVLAGLRSRERAGEGAHLTSNFFEDPVLGASISALTEAETHQAMLAASLTADHPQVLAATRKLELQRKVVGKLLKSAKQNLTTRKLQIEKQLETATAALSTYPEKDVQMARLMRDVEVSQKLYAFLLERHREAEILEASTTIDKRVVDAASMPHRMTNPKRGRLAATGLASALLAACISVWLAHVLQRRLHTVEAIKRELNVPVYGSLPQLGAVKEGRARLDFATVWGDAHGPAAEAFRALCVSVALSPSRGRGRVIQVTSSQPGEGKSTVIANLAVSLRKTGAKVLIVDLDLRKPVQHRQWKISRTPGYAELVAAGGSAEQSRAMMQHVEAWGLDALAAGARLPDTMSSLMSPLLVGLIEEWSAQYDFVLLDSPPAFVPDTTIVARHADLVLVVARPGVVERASLRYAIAALDRAHVTKGLVLNGVTRRHSEDYYGSSYAYAYGSAYGEKDDAPRAAAS